MITTIPSWCLSSSPSPLRKRSMTTPPDDNKDVAKEVARLVRDLNTWRKENPADQDESEEDE
jgi:hypothetical protein